MRDLFMYVDAVYGYVDAGGGGGSLFSSGGVPLRLPPLLAPLWRCFPPGACTFTGRGVAKDICLKGG